MRKDKAFDESWFAIFKCLDYKKILHNRLLEKKRQLSSINFQGMAKACRIQKAYLSRVFHDDANLSEDQVFAACVYLGFTSDEREYTCLSHASQRTENAQRKALALEKMAALRRRQEIPDSHLDSDPLGIDQQAMAAYYLDPNMLLAHTFLGLEPYAKNLRALAQKLHVSVERLAEIIRWLENLGIIEAQADRFVVTKRQLHLPADSTLRKPYRLLMRMKALEQIQNAAERQGFDYSVMFTANAATAAAIQTEFLKFLRAAQRFVAAAPDEEVYQMNFDLIPWGR